MEKFIFGLALIMVISTLLRSADYLTVLFIGLCVTIPIQKVIDEVK